jgi:YNFM family putative membrane transporter
MCWGFFTIHSTAVGLLNRKLVNSQGRANSLYVLFYYAGGWVGITGAGFGFELGGWNGVIYCVAGFLVIPVLTGVVEKRTLKRSYK